VKKLKLRLTRGRWQPIASAPGDDSIFAVGWADRHGRVCDVIVTYREMLNTFGTPPTHWLPIPRTVQG
jgi:hypothetical protein